MLNNLTTRAYVTVVSYLMTLKNEEGQGMAEYGLILAGIAVLVMAAVWLLGGEINTVFGNVKDAFTNPGSGGS